jgi:hypothetical protein
MKTHESAQLFDKAQRQCTLAHLVAESKSVDAVGAGKEGQETGGRRVCGVGRPAHSECNLVAAARRQTTCSACRCDLRRRKHRGGKILRRVPIDRNAVIDWSAPAGRITVIQHPVPARNIFLLAY